MPAPAQSGGGGRVIIIKKKGKGHGGGHGGAWKVAYADFVTAMMALFIVLWLLAQTDKEMQKEISEYFRTGVFSGAPSILEGGSGLLDKGEWLGNLSYTPEERTMLAEFQLLAAKPVLFVANVSEGGDTDEAMVKAVREFAERRGARVVTICGQLEAELSSLPESERADFLKEMGLAESGLVRLTREAYQLLRIVTFFTAGEVESRAWPIPEGTKAPQAAGKIHTDMERGFIRTEVYHYDDLLACGSEAKVKEKGLFRLEGKEYVIKEGDVVYFRFNV